MSPISASFDGDKAVCLRTAITRRPTDSRVSLLHESQSRAPESSCHESLSYSTQMPADRHNKSGRISLTPIQSRDPRLRRTGAFSSTPLTPLPPIPWGSENAIARRLSIGDAEPSTTYFIAWRTMPAPCIPALRPKKDSISSRVVITPRRPTTFSLPGE